MSSYSQHKKKISSSESELYLLIAKFLKTGPCKQTADLLTKEIEEHELLPKRIDWLGNEHNRSFNEFEQTLSQIPDDYILKICTRIGPILDKEIPPTVPGLTSLLGVGRQSLLRTKEDLQKPKFSSPNLAARKNGMPLLPAHSFQSTYPPNLIHSILSREISGPSSIRHTFTPKMYAKPQLYRRLLGHLSSVYCVLFDRTGKYIFTGADDLLVKVWSAVEGRLLASLRGHSAEITDMAVNYENTLLAAGSCDKTIRVWCLRTLAPVAVLSGHTGMVTSLQFCPYPKNEEKLLISTGNDGCVCFWHWSARTLQFNPKPLKFTERNKANAQMICSSFSSGGVLLATGSTDNNVRVYNVAGPNGPEKILEREVHTDRVDSIQFSNRDCRFISGSKDGTALIWKYERQSWTTIQLKMSTKLPGQPEEPGDAKLKLLVTMVSWAIDDDKVITAVSDRSIKVWNSFNGNLIFNLKGHEDDIFVLEPHPTDSRVFLSGGHDGRIIIWDLVTGNLIKNFFNLIEGQGHGAVFDCKFSPDGLMYASTDSHGHLSMFGFGSADPYKKVPEEQFFHTDYRPLIRDIHHHVLDEQTQTAPHMLPPPFLVDIDGNPYPPNLQRLVPGREHQNDSQLVPYVAVSAEGDSEILEPVRPANDGQDRPTIDDMIDLLQQERNQNDGNNENPSVNAHSDVMQSPHSSHRSVNGNEDRNGAEPFSPRTPRSQASHSRVGLRRTGEHEGVQSVGNWQSRNSQFDLPSGMKRVVVKPMLSTSAEFSFKKRLALADNEINLFNKEKKRRPLPDKHEELANKETNTSRHQRRTVRRAGLRTRTQGEILNNAFGEEFENPNNINSNDSSSSETEEQEDSDSTEESGSEDYSDWAEDVPSSSKPKPKTEPQPSTSTTPTSRRLTRRIKPRRRLVSSDEGESDDENNDNDEESSQNKSETSRMSTRKSSASKKKITVNGKKLKDTFRPPEWLTDVMPHKVPYVPQIGDEVVYFRQGHELYVQAVKRNRIYEIYMRSQPWRKINLRDQEVAVIEDINFENRPPRLVCLELRLVNPAEKGPDTFVVKYHDMPDVIDFIVLKQTYDQAMYYDWKPGDRFRSAIDKAWWLGTIKAQQPLNENFPDSMFQCFIVKWDNGEKEQMSPWDFEPIDTDRLPDEEGGSVDITSQEQMNMMYLPEPHEWWEYGQDHDCDRIARGFARIMELKIAESFVQPVDLNLYPSYAMVVEYPIDLGTIKARVQNRFYRRLDAIKFDIRFIEINAHKFNEPSSRIVKQAKCVVDLCLRFINSPDCSDTMELYNEMMEAKQSRSQDSQSELDVLCSEIDSEGENYTSSRSKRKKQNALHQSNKRVGLENQKYTSSSWRQQCVSLLTNFFQCDDSTPFRHPVNLTDYPDYRNIIDIPMDLSTVQERVNSNHYSNPAEFCKDMRLIFQNSRNYNTNKKSRIYSMTIRLSAMFEEHIRSIISDWRSAVKYEEKIRNNQFVSNRRKPILLQEPDVNIGASTSRSITQNSILSRHLRHAMNSVPESSSSRGHMNRLSNGLGSKKKTKEEPQSSRGSAVHSKKKNSKPAIGVSLTNGARKSVLAIQKRNNPVISPKNLRDRSKRKDLYEENSQSDSNNSSQSDDSSENDEEDDTDWNHKSKRPRRDSPPPKQKSLRSRNNKTSLRPTRSSYQQPLSSSSSLRSHNRTPLPRSRSSSPDDRWAAAKKRTVGPPLHKRSKRLCNSTIKKPVYKDSDPSSDSEEESESQSFKSDKNSNSSNSSSKFSRARAQTRISQSNDKIRQSDSSSESEPEHNENPRPDSRRTTRVTGKSVRVGALSARLDRTPRKSGRIVTRNRGARTVQYQEGNSDESENDVSRQSSNSRGSLRSLMNDDEQNPGTRKRATEKSMGSEESFTRKASSSAHDPSSAYGATDFSNCNLKINHNNEVHRNLKSVYTKPYKAYLSSIPLRTRSAMSRQVSRKNVCGEISKPYKRSLERKISTPKEDNTDSNETIHDRVTKFHRTSSYHLRKCSKLIKRSVYQRRSYTSLMSRQNNTAMSGSTSFRRRGRPRILRNVENDNAKSINNKLSIRMKSKISRNIKNYSPISLNTRSKLPSIAGKLFDNTEKTTKRVHAPTIVFCKPSVATNESDSKYNLRIVNSANSNLNSEEQVHVTLNEKHASTVNGKLSTEGSKSSHSDHISSHTRSSNSFPENHKESKKQILNNTLGKKINIIKEDNLKGDNFKGHKAKLSNDDSSSKDIHTNEKNIKYSSEILQSNKSKWCLRKPYLTRVSTRISQNISESHEKDSRKIQTRNRGQRTVIYNEDVDNNYFENENPSKSNSRHVSDQSDVSNEPPDSISDDSNDTSQKSEFDDSCSAKYEKYVGNRQTAFPRQKKKTLKILSDGIETRNHGQRTTFYAEDNDDYLEEYFKSLESGLEI